MGCIVGERFPLVLSSSETSQLWSCSHHKQGGRAAPPNAESTIDCKFQNLRSISLAPSCNLSLFPLFCFPFLHLALSSLIPFLLAPTGSLTGAGQRPDSPRPSLRRQWMSGGGGREAQLVGGAGAAGPWRGGVVRLPDGGELLGMCFFLSFLFF